MGFLNILKSLFNSSAPTMVEQVQNMVEQEKAETTAATEKPKRKPRKKKTES